MVNPLTLISAANAASDVVSGVAKLVSGNDSNYSKQNTEESKFSEVLEDVKSSDSSTNPSDEVNNNTTADTLEAPKEVVLLKAGGGSEISSQTLDDLNNILSGNGPAQDLQSLSEALIQGLSNKNSGEKIENTENVNILGVTKLDDPFGIKAAEANTKAIATALTPADSGLANLLTTETGEALDQSLQVATSSLQKQTDNVNSLNAEAKEANKGKILSLADKIDGDAVSNLQNNSLKSLDGNKLPSKNISDGQNVANIADRVLDKNVNIVSNNPSIIAHQLDTAKLGEINRIAKAKFEVQEKLATVDTYKVVSISKKDDVIDLRLDPQHLGKVQIKLDFSEGKANISIVADRVETLGLLQKDTKPLEKILTDNGFKADSSSLSFDLRQQSQQQQQQQNSDNFNFFSGKPLSFLVEEQISNILAANDSLEISGYANYGTNAASGMLNIMV